MSQLKSSSQQSHFKARDTEVQGGQPGHTLRHVFPSLFPLLQGEQLLGWGHGVPPARERRFPVAACA